MQQRLELVLGGRVQGVGFRPFVFRLATDMQLDGWVRNEMGIVRLQVQGEAAEINTFCQQLIESAPVTAQPEILASQHLEPVEQKGFDILDSVVQASGEVHVPPDYFLCPDCLRELSNHEDRRYAYPFINCTACGPRYTIIKALPYDRANTTMAGFLLCAECEREYHERMDRRFHAEPIACPRCGPQLSFESNAETLQGDAALQACLTALQQGEIVIIKGIGGYHLCCDATNVSAIDMLRRNKGRPHKPLAVMFPATGDDELDWLRQEVVLDPVATQQLRSPARPIVLLPRRDESRLPDNLAPGIQELGVMLPYSPLHTLLLSRFAKPMVATSANLSGEPVLIEADEVNQRLAHISQYRLHHNRPIARPADDPVVRIIHGQSRPIRLGRGTAPLELSLPIPLTEPVLACGGQMKNTIALAWDRRVVISPHIGDLHTPRGQQVYAGVIDDLQQLYGINAEVLICDNHPDYYSSRWAGQQRLPTVTVAHHHAHASILAGEYPDENDWLVFTWDGVGLGEDNTLWGGEALYGRAGQWQRVASWRCFYPPGGDRVAREPWRSAQALCWQTDTSWSPTLAAADLNVLHTAWQSRLNSPATTAVGRLFDAAAALLGVCELASFEGQGPMLLEQLAQQGHSAGIELPLIEDGDLLCSDWQPLLSLLLDEKLTVADRAYAFHASLAQAMVQQVRHIQQHYGDFAIGLSGGVFQNRLLCELIMQQCQQHGFRVYLPQQVPVNDAGLCYGQVIEGAARLQQGAI